MLTGFWPVMICAPSVCSASELKNRKPMSGLVRSRIPNQLFGSLLPRKDERVASPTRWRGGLTMIVLIGLCAFLAVALLAVAAARVLSARRVRVQDRFAMLAAEGSPSGTDGHGRALLRMENYSSVPFVQRDELRTARLHRGEAGAILAFAHHHTGGRVLRDNPRGILIACCHRLRSLRPGARPPGPFRRVSRAMVHTVADALIVDRDASTSCYRDVKLPPLPREVATRALSPAGGVLVPRLAEVRGATRAS